ncbi:DEAD/DEAH box helicase [Clostridium tagluense]|uniref:DEAD/DEAH box helicase n=1 Tax=Clostridium tagluense TaxID=360422 RepID=UPI001CF2FB20|nr:DEAD/DEAH box helicase [Clostridium tagluense]MCB2314158.1 DEAD/DEAH box helicase [Clostridium tagluense]MCB2318985.1 DEAD/DEAH box helicase [Clostridium tagluense]MCB2323891.1 DEAD/DEAH box helicase [Clostridium tagluense]MCB2328716.1 DEAD/DEAH box helicase [Clostridium tagluense]MCB2333609.1 DEAD/DEAH box helicase [Clostridium tagluense]
MILNGGWIETTEGMHTFILWAENGQTKCTRKGRIPKDALPLYEEMASVQELRNKLNNSALEIKCGKYKYDAIKNKLLKREIRGITFSDLDSFHIILNIDRNCADGIELSQELKFWITVAKFTAELIIKHKYLPSLSIDRVLKKVNSRWRWHTSDSEYIDKKKALCGNMPTECKAYFPLDSEGFKYTNTTKLVSDFIDSMIDSMVRFSCSEINTEHDYLREGFISLGSTWIHSLFSIFPEIPIDTSDQIKMLNEYKKWIEPLKIKKNNFKFRTCFKVMPPTRGEEWTIEYLLQAKDDLSLMLPAKMIFEESLDTITYLNKKFNNPQERLLEDLAVASKVFIPIERSLYDAVPVECKISTEEAYSFLRESAYFLKEKGFGIIAPSWWKKPSKLSVKLKDKNHSTNTNLATKSTFNMDTILEYDWKLALDGNAISEKEFDRISNLKVPFIQLRGEWVQIDIHQIKTLSKMKMNKSLNGKIPVGELLRLNLSDEEIIPGISVDNIDNQEAVGHFFEKLFNLNSIEEVDIPKGFSGTLREYQKRGFYWLTFLRDHGIGACLADDMGLGKTVQSICLLLYERENKLTDKPTLIICPTSVVGNWEREIEKFAPGLKTAIHHGNSRWSYETFSKEIHKNEVVITTYALIVRDKNLFQKEEWAGIILDEAQNIKNSASKQTQHIKALKAEYKVALTGTPVENRLSDLWSIMDFLNSGYLYNWSTFRREFAVPIERQGDPEKSSKLRKIISPFVLRRLKTDANIIKDLPEKIETKEYAPLTKEQATLYQAVVNDCLNKIDSSEGIQRRGLIIASLTKFKQICNHPVQFLKDNGEIEGRSGKLERLLEMLEVVIEEGDRSLVFTQFAEMGHILQLEVEKKLHVKTLFLHGGTSRKKREELINIFQDDTAEPMVFVLSLKAGGLGLNLTKANHVFHFDRWWNPAVENQATDRAFRIGQVKNVHVHKFICMGTLEEKIDEMLERKQALAESIVSTNENWISEMNNDELRELFILEHDNIVDS